MARPCATYNPIPSIFDERGRLHGCNGYNGCICMANSANNHPSQHTQAEEPEPMYMLPNINWDMLPTVSSHDSEDYDWHQSLVIRLAEMLCNVWIVPIKGTLEAKRREGEEAVKMWRRIETINIPRSHFQATIERGYKWPEQDPWTPNATTEEKCRRINRLTMVHMFKNAILYRNTILDDVDVKDLYTWAISPLPQDVRELIIKECENGPDMEEDELPFDTDDYIHN